MLLLMLLLLLLLLTIGRTELGRTQHRTRHGIVLRKGVTLHGTTSATTTTTMIAPVTSPILDGGVTPLAIIAVGVRFFVMGIGIVVVKIAWCLHEAVK